MVVFGVLVFPLGLHLCLSFGSTLVSFRSVYVILMFFELCISGYTEEERCTSHTGPGRSCGGKICFPPPLPLSIAED